MSAEHREPYPEVRPNVVAALVGISDPYALTEAEQVALATATEAEIRQAGTVHAVALLEHFRDAGYLKHTTVLDLTARPVVAIAAALGDLKPWWPHSRDTRTLGDALKTVPPETAARVIGNLTWAGLLPADDTGPTDPDLGEPAGEE